MLITVAVFPTGYPVRRKYPQAASDRLTITSDVITEEPCEHHQEDSVGEKYKDVSTCSKRLLPDRTHAAHNRANEKLVHFIVKQRMVEKHLLVGFFISFFLLLLQTVFLHISHPFISNEVDGSGSTSLLNCSAFKRLGNLG